MKPTPKPAPVPGMYSMNPAERWFDARADRAKARNDARRGPLFEREARAREEDADRRMRNAEAAMERHGGPFDLWGWSTVVRIDAPGGGQ